MAEGTCVIRPSADRIGAQSGRQFPCIPAGSSTRNPVSSSRVERIPFHLQADALTRSVNGSGTTPRSHSHDTQTHLHPVLDPLLATPLLLAAAARPRRASPCSATFPGEAPSPRSAPSPPTARLRSGRAKARHRAIRPWSVSAGRLRQGWWDKVICPEAPTGATATGSRATALPWSATPTRRSGTRGTGT